jgi:hypothetical protein
MKPLSDAGLSQPTPNKSKTGRTKWFVRPFEFSRRQDAVAANRMPWEEAARIAGLREIRSSGLMRSKVPRGTVNYGRFNPPPAISLALPTRPTAVERLLHKQ